MHSLRSFGPIVWDKILPDHLKTYTNLLDFKKAVKNWVPDNCICNLCKIFVPNLGYANVIN